MLIDTSCEKYSRALYYFRKDLKHRGNLTELQEKALDDLLSSSVDFAKHQDVWLNSTPLFGDSLPPLRLEPTVHTKDMHPHIQEAISNGSLRVQRISDTLYEHKIPIRKNYPTTEVDDIFNDSFLQKVLGNG